MPNNLFDSKVTYGRYKDIKAAAEKSGKTVYKYIPVPEGTDDYDDVLIFNDRKPYKKIKISLTMLVKVMWELGSCYDKILALLLYNMNIRTNVVPFDEKYMTKNKEKFGLYGISERTFGRVFGMLRETNMLKFGDGRIMVSPRILFIGNSFAEKQISMAYDSFDCTDNGKKQKFIAKSVPSEIAPIKTYYSDSGEEKDCGWRSLGIHNLCRCTNKFSNKRVRGFLYLLYYALYDDCKITDNIKTLARRFGETPETLSKVIKLLCEYGIIRFDVSDNILFNPDYISRSNSSKRNINKSAYSADEKLTFEEMFGCYEPTEIRSPKGQKKL